MPGSVEGAAEAVLGFLFNADNLTADKLGGIADKVHTIVHDFHVESLRVKNFKMDIHWKSRLISIPEALKRIQQIFQTLRDVFENKGQDIISPFTEFVHNLKLLAEEEPGPDPQGGPSKIAMAFSKVEDFITELNKLVGGVDAALDKVKSFGDLFDRILTDIETLDDAFLPQTSKREKTTVTYYKRNP